MAYTAAGSPAYLIGKGGEAAEDTNTRVLINPYRQLLEKQMNEVIANTSGPALKSLPESSLGNLICDVIRQEVEKNFAVRVDVCLLNSGGLRIELPEGPITRSMVYELMPFENELVLVQLSGSSLKLLLDQVAARGGGPLSGLRMKITDGHVHSISIGDLPLQDTVVYNLISSDYIIGGGDRFKIPTLLSQQPLNLKVRDAILQGFIRTTQSGKLLIPMKDGRVILE
jgi:2',3'-cyclic-nucleotide 2'-phosphodiesterase (5'-nucleotidase family)